LCPCNPITKSWWQRSCVATRKQSSFESVTELLQCQWSRLQLQWHAAYNTGVERWIVSVSSVWLLQAVSSHTVRGKRDWVPATNLGLGLG